MHAMQYKITLPNDYDMNIIKKRVNNNGKKTDGFPDLLLKAYLIINDSTKKEYSPLYIWKEYKGMNKFIFEGFYDNILGSFGWQHINIAIPIQLDIADNILHSKYVLEIEHNIQETNKMSIPKFSLPNESCLGKVIVYNPDKWKYVEFYFFENISKDLENSGLIYEILHLSM
ncbi:DUF4865 family protein [Clostridium sp.]|uniref:DUF4865 family protein n=1 Tax=Clostridium sp. TaxID=1506 RepID=UPI00284904C0|nr:DUF4865 family protein [Clostridium sp.]MDR3595656.1 DUF4865 family protein [Clostridium sp.]